MLTRMSATNFLLSSFKLSNLRFSKSNSPFLFLLLVGFSLLSLSACSPKNVPSSSYSHATQGIYSAALSSNGDVLAIGSVNHGGSFWRTNDNERLYNWNHKSKSYSQITHLVFSEDQQFAVTAEPQSIVRWNTHTGEGDALWTTFSEILDIDVFHGGRWAIIGLEDHTAVLFDLDNGGVKEIFNHDDQVNTVAVNSEKNWFATGSNDFTVKLWSTENTAPLKIFQHEQSVQIVEFNQDASLLFSMAQYDGATIWNTETGEAVWQLPLGKFSTRRGSLLKSARFSKDSQFLLTGTSDRKIQLWDLNKKQLAKEWIAPKRNKLAPQGAAVLALSFSDEGSYAAVTSDGVRHVLR